jgi:TM2 domain-containing membrane protein YozV
MLLILGVISAHSFYYGRKRIGGITLIVCFLLIGLPSLLKNISEYKKALNENNSQITNSIFFRISRNIGLLIAVFFAFIVLIINWNDFK